VLETDWAQGWKVHITIEQHKFTIDLRDMPKQLELPFNLSLDATMITCQVFFKMLTSGLTSVSNDGSFRCLEVKTTEGTIFHPRLPAPSSFYYESAMNLMDYMWKAVAKVDPEILPAGHYMSICATLLKANKHPDKEGSTFLIEAELGGWGASHCRDG
jgi:N-methylhydantoinase B